MGKSPGRWMKTLIFGKKSSRSKIPKENHEKRDVTVVVSLDQRTKPKTEEILHSQDKVFVSATPEVNVQNDSNQIREEEEEEAVIDLQAVLRGYLARRKIQKLKGIIRLQALIRGHLVRRQAISTLYCMFHIVKFQALARGRKIRISNIGMIQSKKFNRLVIGSVEVKRSSQILKVSSNNFAQKILASSLTSPMPLHFQYDSNEANSVLSWLERWSTSQCWHQHLNLHPNPKSSDPSKPNTRRSSVTNIASIDVSLNVPVVNCIEENPELVLERIKRNLRKVNNSVLESRNDREQKITTEPEQLRVIEAETMIIRKNEKEDENVNERKKSREVVCVPVKQGSMENDEPSQIKIKRSVPSYMMSTISAKAKLRGSNGPENPLNTITRRHSLPSNLTNSSILVSPLVKTTGKLKNDRSLQLSSDGIVSMRANQAEWRR